jgi:hypothetical protein
MKNATLGNGVDLLAPKSKEERIEVLIQWDDNLLNKVHQLLLELMRAGVSAHKIKENEIKGLSHDELSIIYYRINPLYQGLPLDPKRITRYSHTKNNEGKIKINLDGDAVGFPVFFFSGLENSNDADMERTYMIGPEFENALNEIEQVLNENKKYLIFKDDVFLYHNSKLNIEPNSYGYIIMFTIYNILNGRSGKISYKNLIDALSKQEKFKRLSNQKILEKIQKYATSHTDGIGTHINLKENNGKPLIDVNYGHGITFNNG